MIENVQNFQHLYTCSILAYISNLLLAQLRRQNNQQIIYSQSAMPFISNHLYLFLLSKII